MRNEGSSFRPGPRTIRCESQNNRRDYCAADTRGGVSLLRQLSQAHCVQDAPNASRGLTRGASGCGKGYPAEFRVNPYNNSPNCGNPGPEHPSRTRDNRMSSIQVR